MNQATIDQLNNINRAFYETTASDFDQTRGRAWAGWQALADYLSAPLSVLDVGCGNGRFGIFLSETLDGTIDYHGVDNNAQLLAYAKNALESLPNLSAELSQVDIISAPLPEAHYDCVVLFGVIHHVPGHANRQHFIRELSQRVKSGGMLIFAAWRFYEYERFRERIVDWDTALDVEQHDYLLDWRRGERALRYCHYVDDEELDALVHVSGMSEIKRYRADGSDNRMNAYVMLRKS